jgi:hypothetical protein
MTVRPSSTLPTRRVLLNAPKLAGARTKLQVAIKFSSLPKTRRSTGGPRVTALAYLLPRTVLGAVEILAEIDTKLYDRRATATEGSCTESDPRPWPRSSFYHGNR